MINRPASYRKCEAIIEELKREKKEKYFPFDVKKAIMKIAGCSPLTVDRYLGYLHFFNMIKDNGDGTYSIG
jgi:hypothetical protein